MTSHSTSINRLTGIFLLLILQFTSEQASCQRANTAGKIILAGVAKTDITPDFPMRLAGYGARSKEEFDGILQRLEGKALALGSDSEHASIIITVDLIGITDRIAGRVKQQLLKKAGIDPAQVVICASHTHGGPEIGSTLNIQQSRDDTYTDSLIALKQLVHVAQYTEILAQKLEDVALAALKNRTPSLLAWGQGQAHFAWNRRPLSGPVDVALPILRVTNTDGSLKAVFLNYACHGTTLEGINEVNADWIGEAKRLIELNHPGCMALVALGCGADADPKPRGSFDDVKHNGKDIADNVDKLLSSQLEPLNTAPQGKMTWVKLPFAKIATVPELIKLTQDSTLRGYYARLALDRVERGGAIPTEVALPIQVWHFGNQLAMINLGGEVVVDYAIRLKHEMGAERLWVNGYSNDVPCYIASKRIVREGGYEADFSMFCYDKPSPLTEGAEDIVISAVHELMPEAFKSPRDSVSHQETIAPAGDGSIHLAASHAAAVGPSIKYMPEWKAFGWFTAADRAEWDVSVPEAGKYQAYIEYSVSDDDAGKSFALEVGNKKLKGKTDKTGSWYTYASKKIGTFTLPAGNQKFILKSNSSADSGALFDLREVTLVPVNRPAHEKGFQVLFDGSNLDQWVGNKADYVIEDGVLSLHPENKGGGNLYTKSEYGDFEFRFEFKLTPGANNGIGIRAPLTGDAAYVGMEIQILDDDAEMYKNLHEYQYHGSVYGVIPARRGFLKPTGEWNSEQIIAKGNQIKVILNGTTIVDGDIAKASVNGTLDHNDHTGLKNKTGHIGLLWHETPVQFRNVRVKTF